MRILAIIGALLLGALLIFVGAFGARWFGSSDAPAPEPVVSPPAAEAGVPDALDLRTVRELLLVVDAARRAEILGSPERFAQFVDQETLNQAVLRAAYANGADENEAIGVLMERAGQRVLAEAYLNQVVRVNLDPAFPTDDQVREAYDNNPDAFRLPERMHLWQIFVPLPETATEAERKSAWALAEDLAERLRKGKADFAALAREHSAHEASRVSEGYMGLVRVPELLPAIAEAAAALAEGEISVPIASASGLHIIRKGATVEPEVIDFEKVRDNVRQRLRREAALKLRQAALEKIAEEFPVSAPRSDLETWRTRLQADLPAVAVPPPPAAPDA